MYVSQVCGNWLTDRVSYADEILKYGFCLNVIKTSLCPLEVLKNVQEAVRDMMILSSMVYHRLSHSRCSMRLVSTGRRGLQLLLSFLWPSVWKHSLNLIIGLLCLNDLTSM